MAKLNCWEVLNCQRQPGGTRAVELGVCPAATTEVADGVNGGKNAGRICWCVTGTLCGGVAQGTFAEKQGSCLQCNFYKQVKSEEGNGFKVYLNR